MKERAKAALFAIIYNNNYNTYTGSRANNKSHAKKGKDSWTWTSWEIDGVLKQKQE